MDFPSLLRVVGREHADVRGRNDEHDGAKDRACSHGGILEAGLVPCTCPPKPVQKDPDGDFAIGLGPTYSGSRVRLGPYFRCWQISSGSMRSLEETPRSGRLHTGRLPSG